MADAPGLRPLAQTDATRRARDGEAPARPAPRGPDLAGLLLLPGAALALFVLAPLAALVYRAVQSGPLLDSLRLPLVHEALRLSLVTSAATVALSVVFGTPVAYALARWRFPGRRLLDTLVDLPIVLPPVVAGVALLMAFGRRGVFGGALNALGIQIAFTTTAVVLAQLFVAAPFYIRAARAGFLGVDPDLERIAYTLGASRLRTFFAVSLPLARPAVLSGVVMCWARALSEFGATVMFAGNFTGRTQTLPLAIVSAMESDLFAALAIAVILLALSFALLFGVRLLVGGRGAFE